MSSEKTTLLPAAGENVSSVNAAASSINADLANSTDEPSQETSSSDSKDVPKAEKWTRKQILTAISLSLMNVSLCISFGIISPFYPTEAAKKGATATEVGLVFGVFQLVMFVTAPIYGIFIRQMGAKYMFISGSFILGGCSISFGFLDRCPDGPVYVAMCFICRSVEANGCSMVSTASFAIMATTFPKNVGQALGTLEVFSGIGMVLGPSIGGALYGLGGYLLPFIVIGCLVWITAIAAFFILPPIDNVAKLSGSMLAILKIPGCLVIYLCIVSCGMALSFLDPTFSPWMTSTFKGVTIPQVGLIFMIGPGVYALSAPLSGYISDKGYQASMSVGGFWLTGVAFVLLGPNPLLSSFIPTAIWETVIALILLGLAVGASIIPIFPLALTVLREKGFEDNLQTFGLVSGFFQSGFSLGGFVGPTAAGYFADLYGFAWSSSICAIVLVAVGLVLFGYVLTMKSLHRWPPVPLNVEAEAAPTNLMNPQPPDYGSVSNA
ncbi:MFS-type transporter SLC18B1-like [Watersipora subatra]|uniref:MFS-type transporter SLC18B1-like n=1 Tax=Watersipora subatra TaxID=2589382 RepID=UPI00355AEA1E